MSGPESSGNRAGRVGGFRVGFASRYALVGRYEAEMLTRLSDATQARLDTLIVAPRAASGPGALPRRLVQGICRFVLGAEQAVLRRMPGGFAGLGWRANALSAGRTGTAGLFRRTITVEAGATGSDAPAMHDAVPLVIITLDASLHEEFGGRFGEAYWLLIDLFAPASVPELAGFDSVFEGAERSAFRISLADPGRKDPEVVLEGGNRTKLLFSINQAALRDRVVSSLLTLLQAGVPARREPCADRRNVQGCAPRGWANQAARLIGYPVVAAFRLAFVLLRRRRWSVVVGTGDPLTGESSGWVELRADPGRFYADPQLVRSETGQLHCFVEEYDHALGRARIAVLAEQPDGSWRRLGIALDERHHLSFPFLFRYRGGLYMCPEAFLSDRITVYRCVEFPLRWEIASVVMDGVCAADSMLIEHSGRWWLLTNIDHGLAPDHQAELHVFHADSPLSTDWQAVPGNPVRVDPRGGRNGGAFVADGVLHRCGQRHSIDAYGKGVIVYRISRMDAEGYAEERVADLPTPGSLRAFGTHTLAVCGDRFAIDVLR